MQVVEDRLHGSSQERKVEVSNEFIEAAKKIRSITSDWYAFEYHYISEELAKHLSILAIEINKLDR